MVSQNDQDGKKDTGRACPCSKFPEAQKDPVHAKTVLAATMLEDVQLATCSRDGRPRTISAAPRRMDTQMHIARSIENRVR